MYIAGEGEFPISRLSEISGHLSRAASAAGGPGITSESLLGGVHIENVYTLEGIIESVCERLPDMIRLRNIRLLVIDRYDDV